MTLTRKQKIFADEYLTDLNSTRAYKTAYPATKNEKAAAVNGSRLLRNVSIAGHIEKSMKDREKRTKITQDMVLKELAKIGFAEVTDFVTIEGYGDHCEVRVKPTNQIPPDKIGAIAGIREGVNGIEITLNDKCKALELIGRHLGMFKD